MDKTEANYVKNVLSQYPFSDELKRLHNMLWEYQEISADNALKAQVLSDMPRGGRISNPTLDCALRLADSYTGQVMQIEQKINTLIDRREAIETSLKEMTPNELTVFNIVYVKKCTLKEAEYSIKIDYRNVCVAHGEVLKKIWKNISKYQ